MERENCTEKFQLIAKIYEVLKDDDLRKIYEKKGEWPEDERFNLDETSLARLNVNLLDEFKDYYVGSDEERNDVKKFYEQCKGNILDIIEQVYFAEIATDEARVQGIIDDLVEKKEVTEIKQKGNLTAERKKRIRKAEKEAREAEAMAAQLGLRAGSGMEGLSQAIARRGEAGKSFLDNLEKKYSDLEKKPRNKRSRRGE